MQKNKFVYKQVQSFCSELSCTLKLYEIKCLQYEKASEINQKHNQVSQKLVNKQLCMKEGQSLCPHIIICKGSNRELQFTS